MHSVSLTLVAALGLLCITKAQQSAKSSGSDSVAVRWLGQTPTYNSGVTFGLPWSRGRYSSDSISFSASADESEVDIQSWITAYWPDGSVKWSAHAIAASDSVHDEYTLTAVSGNGTSPVSDASGLIITESEASISVDTGVINVTFPRSGSNVIGVIETASGRIVCQNGKLILRSQSTDDDQNDSTLYYSFESSIDNVTISEENTIRALVTVRGKHQSLESSSGDVSHDSWLPFILRFYLYADSEAIRTVHTILYDGKPSRDFIRGAGIRFEIPVEGDELFDRHIRLAGVDGGVLSEAVQGITGLRRDPGEEVRQAQINGSKTPDISTWDNRTSSRMQWIPAWNDYNLIQLSPDGFTLRKRTKAGQAWINIPGGRRAGGLAYLGGATTGGLALGLRDFWKKYPTALDISKAATNVGELTLWLYSPDAQPLDLRPFHDGLGQDTYKKQLDALEITYEDYEPGYNTPYGIAKTSEIYIYGFEATPDADTLAALTEHTNEPPVLVPTPEYIAASGAIGTYWQPPASIGTNLAADTIEGHLDFLTEFYQGQISQRRWYGFFDHGDFMHTYDVDRHTWRYDVGGYAWDNSELSPDLFF